MDTQNGTVLTVCTANVCRSPLAQRLLERAWIGSGITVSSAGTRALVHASMCPVSAEQLPADDPLAADHLARSVTRAHIEAADLVLAMEREQRSALVREAPGSQAKVFTLREAVALAEALRDRPGAAPIASVPDLAAAMHAMRGIVQPPARPEPKRRLFRPAPPAVDPLTIADGHGHDEATHRAATDEVREMTTRFARAAKALLPA